MTFSVTAFCWKLSSLLSKAVIASTSWSNWFFIKSTSTFNANWFCSMIFQVQYECLEVNCGLWTKDGWASFCFLLRFGKMICKEWCMDACRFFVLMYEWMNEWMDDLQAPGFKSWRYGWSIILVAFHIRDLTRYDLGLYTGTPYSMIHLTVCRLRKKLVGRQLYQISLLWVRSLYWPSRKASQGPELHDHRHWVLDKGLKIMDFLDCLSLTEKVCRSITSSRKSTLSEIFVPTLARKASRPALRDHQY